MLLQWGGNGIFNVRTWSHAPSCFLIWMYVTYHVFEMSKYFEDRSCNVCVLFFRVETYKKTCKRIKVLQVAWPSCCYNIFIVITLTYSHAWMKRCRVFKTMGSGRRSNIKYLTNMSSTFSRLNATFSFRLLNSLAIFNIIDDELRCRKYS